MLTGWYRYVFRNRSALRTWRPADAWSRFVEPDLSTYMGFHLFDEVCHEHLRRFASRYSLPGIVEMGCWWTRGHQAAMFRRCPARWRTRVGALHARQDPVPAENVAHSERDGRLRQLPSAQPPPRV